MAKDALSAHARDELGVSEISTARPVQAALTSAATFSLGAAAPLVLVLVTPPGWVVPDRGPGLFDLPGRAGVGRGESWRWA